MHLHAKKGKEKDCQNIAGDKTGKQQFRG